jgi:hypothetical protein
MKLIFDRIKIPYPLQWGAPTFDAGHAFGMMAAALVSLIEVILKQTRELIKEIIATQRK